MLERRIAAIEAQLTATSPLGPDRQAERLHAEEMLSALREERQERSRSRPLLPRAGDEERRRLKLALIEERIEQLARRSVAAERLQTSALVIATLGERPTEATRAALWNQGVDALHRYRARNAILRTAEREPLGPAPPDPSQNREWRHARREIARARSALGLERDSGIERSLA